LKLSTRTRASFAVMDIPDDEASTHIDPPTEAATEEISLSPSPLSQPQSYSESVPLPSSPSDVAVTTRVEEALEGFVPTAINGAFAAKFMVLPVSESICFIINISEGKVVALGTDRWHTAAEIEQYVGLTEPDIPGVRFVCCEHNWFDVSKNPITDAISLLALFDDAKLPSGAVARRVAECISRLKPVTISGSAVTECRGENNSYIFELLRFAAKASATHISFTVRNGDSPNAEKQGLLVMHNGQPMSLSDILLLSGGDKFSPAPSIVPNVLTIQRLKCLFLRFQLLIMYDESFGVMFECIKSTTNPGSEFTILPRHLSDANRQTRWDHKDTSPTLDWCHLQLERPYGSTTTVTSDLDALDPSVPALLGFHTLTRGQERLASSEGAATKWKLDWGDYKYMVSLKSPYARADAAVCPYVDDSSFAVVVQTRPRLLPKTHASYQEFCSNNKYIVLSIHFASKTAAVGGRNVDCCVYFAVDDDNCPLYSDTADMHSGRLHELLPTLIELPMRLHFQAPWSLTVDKDGLEVWSHNAWNLEILQQLPTLCVRLLLWNSRNTLSPDHVSAVLELLPAMKRKPFNDTEQSLQCQYRDLRSIGVGHDSHEAECVSSMSETAAEGKLVCEVLGQEVNMTEVVIGLHEENVVPVLWPPSDFGAVDFEQDTFAEEQLADDVSNLLVSTFQVRYTTAKNVVWLPAALTSMVHPVVLKAWLGVHGVASHCLTDASRAHPLWTYLPTVTPRQLSDRRNTFGNASLLFEQIRGDKDQAEKHRGCLLSALLLSSPYLWNDDSEREMDSLPPLPEWPIFPVRDELQAQVPPVPPTVRRYGKVDEVLWFGIPEYMEIPKRIRRLLRTVLIPAFDAFRNSKSFRSNAAVGLLTEEFLELIDDSIDRSGDDTDCAELLATLTALTTGALNVTVMPTQIWISCYLDRLFASKAEILKGSPEEEAILFFFRWAYLRAAANAVKYVLTETAHAGESYLLVSTHQCFLGSAYGGNAEFELTWRNRQITVYDGNSSVAAAPITFVSPVYVDYILSNGLETTASADNATTMKKISHFLRKAGAQYKVALQASSHVLAPAEVDKLPRKALPVLRTSSPSAKLYLPYGLGVMTRREINVVDADLTDLWKTMFGIAGSDVRAASGLCSLVGDLLGNSAGEIDLADVATSETTPCAAAVLTGKPTTEVDNAGNVGRVPLDSPYPVFQRAFYLPPGQSGATAVSLLGSPAQWLLLLSSVAWIPAARSRLLFQYRKRSHQEVEGTLVLSPSQVCLPGIGQRSHAGSFDMPVAILPLLVLASLSSAPPAVQRALGWGTSKPRPPVEQLEQTVSSMSKIDLSTCPQDQLVTYWEDLLIAWHNLAVCDAQTMLSSQDIERISLICTGNQRDVPCIPGTCPGLIRTLSDCVYFDRNMELKQLLSVEGVCAECLCELSLLTNVHATAVELEAACDVSSNFKELVRKLFDLQCAATVEHARRFLLDTCGQHPVEPTISPVFAAAYSCSLWMVVKESAACALGKEFSVSDALIDSRDSPITVSNGSTPSPTTALLTARINRNKILLDLKTKFPSLSILCAPMGHGICPDSDHPADNSLSTQLFLGLVAQWVPLFSSLQPVFSDGSSSSSSSSSSIESSHCVSTNGSTGEVTSKDSGAKSVAIPLPVCAFPVSEDVTRILSLLRPRHGIQCIALLANADAPVHVAGNSCRCSTVTSALTQRMSPSLADIDRALILVLGIKQLSDPKSFSIRIVAEGKERLRESVGLRVNIVVAMISLLMSLSQDVDIRHSENLRLPMITMTKFDKFCMELVLPNGQVGRLAAVHLRYQDGTNSVMLVTE
jgi:hypothetical protein